MYAGHRSQKILLLALMAGAAAGCSVRSRDWAGREEIQRILHRQDQAWNAGDIEGFMQFYSKSPGLTFSSGGKVTRGWQETLDNYRRRYPDRTAMGRLSFSDLEITPLGDDFALVLGRWHLERAEPVGGAFSLVMRREQGRWLIVHDHTSRDPANK